MHLLTRSSLGLFHIIFRKFVPELWPFIYAQILFSFNILRANGQNFTKFYICIHIDMIYVGNVTHHFSHICTRVIALDLLQNFVSAQGLENKWTDFGWGFSNIVITCIQSLCLYTIEYMFNIIETNGRILTKLYITICTDKIYVGIVSCHFSHICTSVMALDFAKLYICIHIDKIIIGIVTHHFSHICSRVMTLDLLQNFFILNILRTNGQSLTKFYITIYTDKIYVGIVSCHFSQICKGVMALDWCQNYVTTQFPETLWPFTACKALQWGYSQILWQF